MKNCESNIERICCSAKGEFIMLHKNTELQIANSKFPMNVRFRGNFFVIFQFALIDY